MTKLDYDAAEDRRERFRLAVLHAMDESMNRIWLELGVSPRDNCTGARDADLPELFKALDAQFALNCAHAGVVLEG